MSRNESERVELDLHLHRETLGAFLVSENNDEEASKHWLPKSQVRVVSKASRAIRLDIPEWLAKDRGLI